MSYKYQTHPVCKWCPNLVKKYYSKGHFKNYLRTCGNKVCLLSASKDTNVRIKKRYHQNRICQSCAVEYEAASITQRWCKKCSPDKKASTLLQRYNISAPEFSAILVSQNGNCTICLRRKAKVVDHDHKNGRVRGIICGYCNTALHLVEHPEELQRAQDYLKNSHV